LSGLEGIKEKTTSGTETVINNKNFVYINNQADESEIPPDDLHEGLHEEPSRVVATELVCVIEKNHCDVIYIQITISSI
jgi:hypothetical protein